MTLVCNSSIYCSYRATAATAFDPRPDANIIQGSNRDIYWWLISGTQNPMSCQVSPSFPLLKSHKFWCPCPPISGHTCQHVWSSNKFDGFVVRTNPVGRLLFSILAFWWYREKLRKEGCSEMWPTVHPQQCPPVIKHAFAGKSPVYFDDVPTFVP